MSKKKITVKELAKILGVSISTVSKSLNDSYEISDKTKRRVKKLAKKYHYIPNRLAVNLKSGNTKTIGVILPSILNTFFTRVLYGIAKVSAKENYNMITCVSNESYEKEVVSTQILSNGSIDGLIVAVAEESQIKENFDHFNTTIEVGIPIVMFDRIAKTINCDKVIVDDYNDAYLATQFLIHKNCKNIILLSSLKFLNVGKFRVNGYKKAIQENFGIIDDELIVITEVSNLEHRLGELLSKRKIDGIFTVDEDASLAAVKMVRSKGFNIPNEISIIGYSGEKMANNLSPTLTTVNQHGVTIGKAAAKILIERLKKKELDYRTKVIKTNIEERQSTKKSVIKKDNLTQ